VRTLEELRSEQPAASLCLVMGGDAFAGLPSWYHWREIPELANIVVIERPGAALAAQQSWAQSRLVNDAQQLRDQPAGQVLPQCLTRYDISATRLREAFSEQAPVDGKLPDSVIAYIRQHRLYGAHPRQPG
jgi:nicotinate-nucleotide adenylyltransferase